MNTKFLIALFFIVVIAVGIVMSKNIQKSQGEVLGDEMDVVRVGMNGERTEFGFVKVHINGSQEDPGTDATATLRLLNVALDLNNSGTFEEYDANGQPQSEWIIRDMPVRMLDEQNSFSFFFPDKTAEDSIPSVGILMRAVITDENIMGATEQVWDGEVPQDAESKDKMVQIDFEDVGNLQSPGPGKDGSFGFLYSDGYASFAGSVYAQGAEEINVFHPGVPDIDQGVNECAPTSAANSLLWLAEKFDFQDKLPSQAELIGELKDDMNWDNGISPNDFLPGKEAITARRGLPLVNHQLGNFNGTGTFGQMADELKKDQDVEMRIQYKDADGNNTGGHWVTVVGLEQMANGTQIIDVHDPLSPGPAKLQRYRLDNTANGIQLANYPYGRAYVSFAIAESYEEPADDGGSMTDPGEETDDSTGVDDSEEDTPSEETTPTTGGTGSDPSTESDLVISVSPTTLSFVHRIGSTSCPQPIGSVKVSSTGGSAAKWKIYTPLPSSLQFKGSASGNMSEGINLEFTCEIATYESQTLNTSLQVSLLDANGQPTGVETTLNVNGQIIAEERQ